MKNLKNKPSKSESSTPVSELKKDLKPILMIGLNLLVICAVTALLLSVVNALTADKIAANIAEEKIAAIQAIFPEADESQTIDVHADGVDEIRLVFTDGDLLGYAAVVNPIGFGGKIEVMVGVRTDGTLAGIEIISHSETPGFGTQVSDKGYLSQYIGRSGKLTLGGTNGIDAITGSTISSKAVIEGVNNALAAHGVIFAVSDIFPEGGTE